MKILLCGGGTGGHFYPLISVAQALNTESTKSHVLRPELYYLAPTPYDTTALFVNNIIYKKNVAGKMRRYFSLLNFTDVFVTAWGIITALYHVFRIYPDVVFGKGGYSSFPILFAARLLRIPVIIHESDSKPGRVNSWAGKFAERIALSYPEAAKYFPEGKTAVTGNPIRKELQNIGSDGAHAFFGFDPAIPTILIMGGSQGAGKINEVIIDILPELIKHAQIIHQTGPNNFEEVKKTSHFILEHSEHPERYHPMPSLNTEELIRAVGACNLIISRAGSTIFEIAAWAKPSIIIPIPQRVSHDQTSNAFAYARTGAAEVIEEDNLTGHILLAEISRILNSTAVWNKMSVAAKAFSHLDAAEKIADEILSIGLAHGE